MSVTVLHSQDRSAPTCEMDESELEPWSEVVADNDLYRQAKSGYRCKCHGWVVQESGRVDFKVGIASLLAVGEIK